MKKNLNISQSFFWCFWSWNTWENLWPTYSRWLYRVLLEKTSDISEIGNSNWKKIGHFSCLNEIIHSTIALCIHVSLFKCYETESFECWCAEKPLQKCDNSLVHALYRHQKYSIPEEGSLSGVSMLALFPHFQVKHSKKFK